MGVFKTGINRPKRLVPTASLEILCFPFFSWCGWPVMKANWCRVCGWSSCHVRTTVSRARPGKYRANAVCCNTLGSKSVSFLLHPEPAKPIFNTSKNLPAYIGFDVFVIVVLCSYRRQEFCTCVGCFVAELCEP